MAVGKMKEAAQNAMKHAHAIHIDALTLEGELLKAQPKGGPQYSRGGGSKGSKREPLPDAPPTRAEQGISKKESATVEVATARLESVTLPRAG
jgi:hypothetical protein